MEKKNNTLSVVLLVVLAVYVLSPADLMPGPVDDIILMLIYVLTNRSGIVLPEGMFAKSSKAS